MGPAIEWDPATGRGVAERPAGRGVAEHPTGRERLLGALELENAVRGNRSMALLSASGVDSWMPEDVSRGATPAQIDFRRQLIRAAMSRWTEGQLKNPGPPSVTRWQQFYSDLSKELAAAGVGNL